MIGENYVNFSVLINSFGRLDRYLVDAIGLKRSQITMLIKDKWVTVNQEYVKPSYSPVRCDEICILWPLDQPKIVLEDIISFTDDHIKTSQFTIPILYQDDDLIVVNKPAGLLVHEATSNTSHNLVTILTQCHIPLFLYDRKRPGIVHRLDQFTEGIMVLVKSELAYNSLKQQFKQRAVKKKYYAVLKGVLSSAEGTIDRPIGRDASIRARQSCTNMLKGTEKDAITHYRVINQSTNVSMVDIDLVTGRTHQIRVHFAALQCPVLGDSLYSAQKQKPVGYFLQSYFLQIRHPKTSEDIVFEIPCSDRLKQYY
jgi:23S rRNA pseudouridine1911/1915/1917 synthase